MEISVWAQLAAFGTCTVPRRVAGVEGSGGARYRFRPPVDCETAYRSKVPILSSAMGLLWSE